MQIQLLYCLSICVILSRILCDHSICYIRLYYFNGQLADDCMMWVLSIRDVWGRSMWYAIILLCIDLLCWWPFDSMHDGHLDIDVMPFQLCEQISLRNTIEDWHFTIFSHHDFPVPLSTNGITSTTISARPIARETNGTHKSRHFGHFHRWKDFFCGWQYFNYSKLLFYLKIYFQLSLYFFVVHCCATVTPLLFNMKLFCIFSFVYFPFFSLREHCAFSIYLLLSISCQPFGRWLDRHCYICGIHGE